jgi:uncharacterized protein
MYRAGAKSSLTKPEREMDGIFTQYFPNGWLHYAVGGACIGLGVSVLFVATGLVGGMSSVYSSTWSFLVNRKFFQQAKFLDSRQWRLMYAAGLVVGAWVAHLAFSKGDYVLSVPPLWLLIGGLIAGFGARLSNGCTSGHGICGMGSFNRASIVAVVIFMVTAIITANLLPLLGAAR